LRLAVVGSRHRAGYFPDSFHVARLGKVRKHD
jgi:hypothetical protein